MAAKLQSIVLFTSMICIILSCKVSSSSNEFLLNSEDDDGSVPTFYATAHKDIGDMLITFSSIWKSPLETNINKLAKSASVPDNKVPYSAAGYPELAGGTNVNGALTRYDQAFGTQAAKWEAENHAKSSSNPTPASWAGHCNGAAAAQQRHKEPQRSVTQNGVTFSRQDIKALLAEIYMSTKRIGLIGNRCDLDSSQIKNDPDFRAVFEELSECEDINAGTFHLVLTNWIGVKKHTIIMDASYDSPVWNTPIHKYSYTAQDVDRSTALSIIGSKQIQYVFNPAASRFKKVDMTVTLPKSVGSEVLDYNQFSTKQYSYVLELNSSNEILGGEWSSASRNNHPDFLWIALEPTKGSGSRRFANPEVDPQNVLKLWASSVNLDYETELKKWEGKYGTPESSIDIMEPEWKNDWGILGGYFNIEIDGNDAGAAFLGKDVPVVIKNIQSTAVGMDVDLYLNGTLVRQFNNLGASEVSHLLKPVVGVNILRVVMKKTGKQDDVRTIRFYAIQ